MRATPQLAAVRSLAVLLVALATACGTTVPNAGSAPSGSVGDNGLGGGQASTGGTSTGTSGDAGLGSTSGGDGGSGAVTQTTGGSTGGASTGATSGTSTGAAQGSGSAGTSTTGGSTGTASATSTIPKSGRGWDATHVYIGVPTADDANAAVSALGANFNNGSFEGDVKAVVADINKSGGMFGRQVVPAFYDVHVANAEADPAGTAQTVCTYFTQDRPVIAVINPAPQFDTNASFHKCLEQDHVSMFSLTNTDYSTNDYKALGPHLWTVGSVSSDILVPTWIAALKRQGYFSGWDTTTGTASSKPAKVGVLLPDDAQGRHVAALIDIALKKAGLTKTSEYLYDASGMGQNSQSEVLRFQAAGVTHILDLPPVELEVGLFQHAAENQHYRPRYGFTSFDLPLTVQENSSLVPPVQQVGSMGIGWQPFNDTDAAHDPGATPGQKRCLGAMAKGGQSFSTSMRRAELIAVGFCDAFYLIHDAVIAGHGFDGNAFLAGMPHTSTTPMSFTFGTRLSVDNHGVPGYYRDQTYQRSCSCFVYVGGNHPFTS